MSLTLLFSCKSDTFSKELFCDNLLSPYAFEAEYTFSKGQDATVGSLRATKEKNTRIDFLSPDTLVGVSVESDTSGQMSNFIVSFSGIKAEIPKEILEKLSLTFSLLNPNLPSVISELDDKCFKVSENPDKQAAYCTIDFCHNDINYLLTYDISTGLPVCLIANTDQSSVTLSITKFKSNA